ncbi:MAG TPA: M23 family metallopeptidase, partial [Magnetospirillaceae bacterium]|nr:M23 family metallopeptidase [Magnetospirillaceae bacterium]
DDMKTNYQAAFGKLDEFQSIFSGITCEITDIQDSLLRITEKSVISSKAKPSMPHLDPDPNKCRSGGASVRLADAESDGAPEDTQRIVGMLPESPAQPVRMQEARLDQAASDRDTLQRRVNELSQSLARLRESHGAFLRHSADLTAMRIGELERTLASVGVSTKAAIIGDGKFGRGGPYIAPRAGGPLPDTFNPISLFNSHADRLDNLATVMKSLPLASPLEDYEMTSPFGARNDPINAMTGIHEGLDMGASTGTPVSATGDGQVAWAGWRDRYGNLVEIDHGNGIRTRYGHLSKVMVTTGAHVARGSIIGLVGETGRTTGPHLHYEVRVGEQATNPMKFIVAGHNVLKTQ